MPRTLRRTIAALAVATLAASVALVAPTAAVATAGDYAVRLTTTSGSHWATYGQGPFIASAQRVHSGHGIFQAGDYKAWRASVAGTGSTIVGGRVYVSMVTPYSVMRGRIVVGTGNSPTVVYDGDGNGGVERAFSGTHDWVQFDLRSSGAVTTGGVAENFINFQWAELTLRDAVPPALAPISLPDPGRWHGAGDCIPFTIRLTDQGGGLLRSQVRRASDGAVVTQLAATQVESTKPGPGEQHLGDCIQPSERGHGDTTFVATVWDVGGTARELTFSARAVQVAPTIGGGPADGARIATTRPAVAFDVGDQGAGLASVTASLDGGGVAVTVAGSTATVHVGELTRGAHVVAIAAVDGAGNATRVERRLVIADDVPPTLAVASPGARGEAAATLTVKATDDQSGVDPATWTAKLDGVAIAFQAGPAQLDAKLAGLAVGGHRIDVSVRDRAGNLATVQHAYYVVPPPPVPEPAAPSPPVQVQVQVPAAAQQAPAGRSGVVLVDGPRRPVGHGRAATVTVQVVRDGGPVASQLVEVRRDDAVVASSLTDGDGVARLTFPAARPGRHVAVAVGMAYEPLDLGVQVAPRLVIATSVARPRVGERVAITGRIFPAIRGRRVAVEARIDGIWFPVRRAASTNGTGRFRSSVVATTPGPVWIRVRLLAVGAWAPAVSNQRVLRVRR